MKNKFQFIDKKFSQNYFTSDEVIRSIIKKYESNLLGKVVIDIGAGKGIITKNLFGKAKKIFAIEIDKRNIDILKKINSENVEIIQEDIRNVDIDKLASKFTIFANIPFFLTSEILKNKLLMSKNIEEAFVYMQKEAVLRYQETKFSVKNSYLSVLFNKYFDIEVVYNFDKKDFFPSPSVDIVLVRFIRNNKVLDPMFFDFIAYMFNVRKSNIKNILLGVFTYNQIRNYIQKKAKFGLDQLCSELNVGQWETIYDSYITLNYPKRNEISGSYDKISRYQAKQNNKIIV